MMAYEQRIERAAQYVTLQLSVSNDIVIGETRSDATNVVLDVIAAFLGDDEVLYQACPNSPEGMYDGNTDCDFCHGLGFVRVTELIPLSKEDS